MTTANHAIDRYWGHSQAVATLLYAALVAVLVFAAWSALTNIFERRDA
jgi:hypothetical protein